MESHELLHCAEVQELHVPEKGYKHVVDVSIDLCGGTAAGIACVYTGQPLDTVKVKMQTFSRMYPNALQCFIETLKKEQIRGLYAGTVPALAANIAENAVLFSAYGLCQKGVAFVTQKSSISELNPVENAAAGSLAGGFASFALCPTELIKCRLQALREMKSTGQGSLGHSQGKIGPWSLTRQVIREEGIRGMFRGLIPTFAREVPGYFFFFGGYEISKRMLTPPGKSKEEIGPFRTIICGGVGGMSLWIMVFPADVVKSRVQVQGSGSFFATLMSIFRKDGFRALYKGLGPTLIRTFFASGALFVAYETTTKVLHDVID